VTKPEIRAAVPADMPRLRELHAITEAKVGMKMDLPEVGDPAILSYWVVERDGVITTGWYEEKAIEHCQIGDDPEATAVIRDFQETLFEMARNKGARFIHCLVPPAMESRRGRWAWRVLLWFMTKASRRVGRHLMKSGFQKTGLVHYNRQVR
jgi:hypothetical protein